MDRLGQLETALPDESTLRVWEDMRSEVLHELQEGAEIPDAVIESTAELAAKIKAWRSTHRPLPLDASSQLQPG